MAKAKINKLSNIDISIISLVDKGANQKHIIWKSDNSDSTDFTLSHSFKIAKVDLEKRMVYGPVYSPNQVDSQGDFATADEIEKASINFMKKSATHAVDTQHDLKIKKGMFVAENWIVKTDDDPIIGKGEKDAWAVGLYIENDEIWESVKKGEFGGLSMYGTANKEEVEESEVTKRSMPKKDRISEFKKFMKDLLGDDDEADELVKDFNSQYDNLNFRKIGNAFQDCIWQIMNDEEITDKKAAVLESILQMQKLVEGVEVVKFEIIKAGKVLNEKNLSALKTALGSINTILESAEKVEKGDNRMSDTEKTEVEKKLEELQKQVEDLKKTVTEETKEETKKTLEEQVEELTKTVDALKKQSTGTRQDLEAEAGKDEVAKSGSIFPWS